MTHAARWGTLLVFVALAACTRQDRVNRAAANTPASVAVAASSAATDLAAAFYARPMPVPAEPIKEPLLTGTPFAANALVMRGQYVARLSGCIGCHTRPGGALFAGGLPLQTPFGVIVSTNITPDKTQGIGNYTLATFDAALRHGKDEEGGNLYPAMPYTNYARMSDDDLAALFAYFMQAVPAAQQSNAHTALAWPFSMKWLLKGWNALYLPRPGFVADTQQSSDWNRGAYLVQSLAHCGACHTPRGFAGAEQAPTERDGQQFLAGALIDGWYAQPLRSGVDKADRPNANTDTGAGLNRWSVSDVADYLRTGRSTHTAAFGAMSDVVAHGTQHLTPGDATAMATYLKSLGGDNAAGSRAAVAMASSTPDPTTVALRAGNVSSRGAMVYLNNCSGCHRSDGAGAARTFPALAHSSTVAATDATSLIRIVLQGSAMPAVVQAPSALAMPGLGWRLNDDDVANVLSFVRSSWGNRAEAVTASDVAGVRAAIAQVVPAAMVRGP
jgi:mono/diheme cytochrome c family protein